MLHGCGLLTGIDRAGISTYCLAWARYVEAEEHLRDEGMMLSKPDGTPYISPWFKVSQVACAEMMRALCEFGMTPSSRTKVKASPPKAKETQRDKNKKRFFGGG